MDKAEEMKWESLERQGSIVATPDGRVDEASATSFAEQLGASVDLAAKQPQQRLVVDLGAIDYMSSRGLRGLTLAKRKADGVNVAMVLAAPNAMMVEILAISRYDKLFTITATLDDAFA